MSDGTLIHRQCSTDGFQSRYCDRDEGFVMHVRKNGYWFRAGERVISKQEQEKRTGGKQDGFK